MPKHYGAAPRRAASRPAPPLQDGGAPRSEEALSPEQSRAAEALRLRILYGRKAGEAETSAAASADPLLRQCWTSIAGKWRDHEARR